MLRGVINFRTRQIKGQKAESVYICVMKLNELADGMNQILEIQRSDLLNIIEHKIDHDMKEVVNEIKLQNQKFLDSTNKCDFFGCKLRIHIFKRKSF